MAFPTTGILSTFTGGDEAPLSESGAYAGPIQSTVNQTRRVSNAVSNPTAGNATGQSYRAAISANDLESGFTVSTLPISGDGVSAWARVQNPGNPTTAASYLAVYTTGTGYRLFKMTAGGSYAQLGSTQATPAMNAGEKLGIEVNGTSVKCKHYTGGAWADRVSATDSSITGAGTVGFECAGASTSAAMRIDDHFGGQIVVPPATTAGSLGLLGVGS